MDFLKIPSPLYTIRQKQKPYCESIMKKEKTPTQHKGRRVPLHLIEKIEDKLQKLIEDNQIFRLKNDLFISPVVIIVKNTNKKNRLKKN